MKSNYIKIITVLLILFVVVILIFPLFKSQNKNIENKGLMNIRIGWQIPWATEGELTQILKHTSILKENSLSGEFKGFASGAPLNEAALAGSVDVIFTADQPVATLLSKDPNWTIIGRLMYNRVSLYVPPKSPIQSVKDLKGKTVGMPFGAAAQRMAFKEEEGAGLDPNKDVKNINLDIYEQSDLVRDKNAVKWGTIDALAGFDPTPAILEEKGLIRNLAVNKVVSVIVMSNTYIKNHPEAPTLFLKSMNSAYQYYKDNTVQADTWFAEESKLSITSHALQIASSLEPNLQPNSQIRLGLNDDDLKVLQDAADFIYSQGLIKTKVNMVQFVNQTYLQSMPNK